METITFETAALVTLYFFAICVCDSGFLLITAK